VRVVHGHPVAGNGTASGSTAAGIAGAAAGSVRVFYNNHGAGYDTAYFDNWRFRYVATTVPVAACRIAPSKNPDAETQLWGGTKWFAAIAVFCNGGAGGVGFYAKSPPPSKLRVLSGSPRAWVTGCESASPATWLVTRIPSLSSTSAQDGARRCA
jgi:hypothetical protein